MEHKAKSVKYTVIAGYLLLFILAGAAIWFLFKEVSKTTSATFTNEDNGKVIRISNAIADLYTSEALGRTSILTGSEADYKKYTDFIDSITVEIDSIKLHVEPTQAIKFDSIQTLIDKKKKSVTDIIEYHRLYNRQALYRKSITKIHRVKDSLVNLAEPLQPETRFKWSEIANSALSREQLDSIRKFASNDSLTQAFDKVVMDMLASERAQRYQLYLKEQQLLEENRVISDQIRIILSSVENEILQNSYAKISGSQHTMSSTITKLTWTGGIALLMVIVFAWIIIRDLTKQQQYRTRLEELNNENKNLLRSKTMLMATVTHDLQTPLGSIIGFSDLMENSGINPKQKQYLSNIKESADYILKLVNDLMDFSKLENKRINIEEVNFNFSNLIENTCKTLEHSAENKGIELNYNIDSTLNNNFLSDPYRLKQVLTNLISNAVKFTSKGSVDVTAYLQENYVVIKVADTGIGIAKERQEEVFQEFTQANPGIEKKFGGTGLGLTISKRILELIGGTIHLDSEEGKGSIFTLYIPAFYNDKAPTEIVSVDLPSLKDLKILIVDDDSTQLSLLKEVFTAQRALIQTEPNSSNVSNIISSNDFDIVITDIQMPVLDGFGVLERIKAIKPHIPVIALSGRKDIEVSYFIERGFTAYHPKPISVYELLNQVLKISGRGENKKSISDNFTATPENKGKFYNLKSLSYFTNNDHESLKMILDTLIISSKENCRLLMEAVQAKNEQQVVEIAHKMSPMLKQIEAFSISDILDDLEDRKYKDDWHTIAVKTEEACDKTHHLINLLKSEIA